MPLFTPRLNLYKPGGGSSGTNLPDEVADIDKINDNMDKVDLAAGARIVTSGTRPSSPFSGQLIRESDTGRTLAWTGSAWAANTSTVVRVADFTALVAAPTTTLFAGDLAFVVEGEVHMSWTGTLWRQVTPSQFATNAMRDTAYAKAGGVFLRLGAQTVLGGWRKGAYFTLWNAASNPGGMRKAGWYIDVGQAPGTGRAEPFVANSPGPSLVNSTTNGSASTQIISFFNGGDGLFADIDFGANAVGSTANFAGHFALNGTNAFDAREIVRSGRMFNGGNASMFVSGQMRARVLLFPGETMTFNVAPIHEGAGAVFTTQGVFAYMTFA